MKIGILAPSIYMSQTHFRDMIFAPRDLAVSLADGLVQKNHEVYLFASPDTKTKAHLVAGEEHLIGEDLVLEKMRELGGERFKWSSYYTRKQYYEADLTAQCFAMGITGKLDIIHSYHDQLSHFYEEATGVSTVYTLHDPIPSNQDDLTYWLYNKYRHHRYVSISDAFRHINNLKLNFVATVYHGLDLTAIPFQAHPSDYLLFMGRMVPEKGLHLAIQAALATQMPLEIGTHFPEKKVHNEYFEKEIKPYLTNPLIQEPGMVTKDKKMKLYGGARALLFPIGWEEPFGMVLVEAMATGTPVIAFNRGSVPEIVEDGVTGFIVDPATGVDGLVEAIKKLPQLDRAATRRHVENKFSVAQMVDGYEDVYRNILSEKPA